MMQRISFAVVAVLTGCGTLATAQSEISEVALFRKAPHRQENTGVDTASLTRRVTKKADKLEDIATSKSETWAPAKGPLMTAWAKNVTPENVHHEYPRPQMRRQWWKNLNGLWDYAILSGGERAFESQGKILVPFCPESALSGVMKPVGSRKTFWYRRTFHIPEKWPGKRILLHFGAVDWHAVVSVNGKRVGEHTGGYDPFTLDITDALKPEGEQTIVVQVDDPTDSSWQPRGKQILKPHGIWYTAVTGIWQTVWIEPVGESFIQSLKITPNVDDGTVTVIVDAANAEGKRVNIEVLDRGHTIAEGFGEVGKPVTSAEIPRLKLWSPDSPHLYSLIVHLHESDGVESYFGMRKIEIRKDAAGVNRLFLNNEPLFQYGPLDQGWWPDGLYTAPCDDALRHDVAMTKRFGMNMCRKHVKIEPDRWYYWCDKLGLLVWQDMPSGDKYIHGKDPDIERSLESAKNFERELNAMVKTHYNHPSIIMWVPYNEGWGQWDTARIAALVKRWDPTRLVNSVSGWTDRGVGDVHDIHRYPGPAMPPLEEGRAAVLGEFGGLGLPIEGHTWQSKGNWGYRSYKDSQSLTDAYVQLLAKLRPMIAKGLAAAVYTQTSDVEIEINGLMTYDRATTKMNIGRAAAAANQLFLPLPTIQSIVPTSEKTPQTWRYTTLKPDDGWEATDFDDSAWQEGPGGFGRKDTPGAVVRTPWHSGDIWLRQTFTIDQLVKGKLQLSVHHDEDATIYVNGMKVAELSGYTIGYVLVPLTTQQTDAFRKGKNTLAVHCHQMEGGQYIDVGVVEVREAKTSQ